jgi:hypothetical protein
MSTAKINIPQRATPRRRCVVPRSLQNVKMKISLIIKILGTTHLLLGVALWGMLIFAVDIVAPGSSPETV